MIWTAAATEGFLTQFRELKSPKLSAERKSLTVSIRTPEMEVRSDALLSIVRGDGKTILATGAAAYMPKRADQ